MDTKQGKISLKIVILKIHITTVLSYESRKTMTFLRWQPILHPILLVTIAQRPVQWTNKQNKRANWDRTSRRVLIKSQWSEWDSNTEPSARHRLGGGALTNWAVNRIINNGNDFLWQQPTNTTFPYFAKLVPEQRGQRNKNSLKNFSPDTHFITKQTKY